MWASDTREWELTPRYVSGLSPLLIPDTRYASGAPIGILDACLEELHTSDPG